MVRIGMVGVGNMGSAHAKSIFEGNIENACLVGICDIADNKIEWAKETFGDKVTCYKDYKEMVNSGEVDAVMIATPHYFHPEMVIYGLEHGVHVLSEKPAGVYTKAVREMNEVAKKHNKVFGIVYNQRTSPMYQKVREIVKEGKLGELKRMVWIITNWYRTQNYYDSGSWRATWAGEGGGVLTNQCPHNLDLWQWIFGMPKKVTGFVSEGKYHNIEVEDDVTAYAEYENGATAVFITTTGECPGTNRLEITGDKGKIVVEEGKVIFHELAESEREFCFTADTGFATPDVTVHEMETGGEKFGHNKIIQNFTNAILSGEELIAPGVEGILGLEISNAIYLSGWTGESVTLPINEDVYYEKLQEKIKNSKTKPEVESKISDLHGSFSTRWEVK